MQSNGKKCDLLLCYTITNNYLLLYSLLSSGSSTRAREQTALMKKKTLAKTKHVAFLHQIFFFENFILLLSKSVLN